MFRNDRSDLLSHVDVGPDTRVMMDSDTYNDGRSSFINVQNTRIATFLAVETAVPRVVNTRFLLD